MCKNVYKNFFEIEFVVLYMYKPGRDISVISLACFLSKILLKG